MTQSYIGINAHMRQVLQADNRAETIRHQLSQLQKEIRGATLSDDELTEFKQKLSNIEYELTKIRMQLRKKEEGEVWCPPTK